jgi:hypothetical protein
MTGTASFDLKHPELGYTLSIPCPYFCWQFWKWQKVRCQCGKEFVSRDLGLVPPEYEKHYKESHFVTGKYNHETRTIHGTWFK